MRKIDPLVVVIWLAAIVAGAMTVLAAVLWFYVLNPGFGRW